MSIDQPSKNSCSTVKQLPKLGLPVFYGNVLKQLAFRDSFETAIHYHLSLTYQKENPNAIFSLINQTNILESGLIFSRKIIQLITPLG
jgi:hypothetical protein